MVAAEVRGRHGAPRWGEEQEKRAISPLARPLNQNWQGGMFLCSLPQGCSVHPSWHGHCDPLLISTQNHPTRSKLSSASLLPMGLSSSPGIFRKLCSSRAFGLREVTPGQQADGAGEMGEPHK